MGALIHKARPWERSEVRLRRKKNRFSPNTFSMEGMDNYHVLRFHLCQRFEITSQHHHYRRWHLCIFHHCISTVRLCKTETRRFIFFFFLLNFSLEGQKCCHIAYSNQFKQYQIFPKEQKRINQHVKNSLLLPLAQLSQASPNLQLSPVGEDVNEVPLKTAVLRIAT